MAQNKRARYGGLLPSKRGLFEGTGRHPFAFVQYVAALGTQQLARPQANKLAKLLMTYRFSGPHDLLMFRQVIKIVVLSQPIEFTLNSI